MSGAIHSIFFFDITSHFLFPRPQQPRVNHYSASLRRCLGLQFTLFITLIRTLHHLFSKMSNVVVPINLENVYFDLTITNIKSELSPPVPIYFNESRTNPRIPEIIGFRQIFT
jgi:hypothetical protein